jgi:prevent-host-death family protein
MEQVGSYEAKAHLAELLDKVERGESILITRNGRPAALLSPPPRSRSSTVEQTIADLREFGKRYTLRMDLRTAIEAGRR